MKQFSKRLLFFDYLISSMLIITFIVLSINQNAYLSDFGMIICAWIAQLGISSAAYYVLVKSEHRIELPMILLNDLPDDIKEQVDLTTIITTILSNNE